MTSLKNKRIIVQTGDITQLDVDVIVNAANATLLGGGGVDGAIHRAGGPEILEQCQAIRKNRYPKGLPTGEAVVTSAGNMKARYVIHTVGPIFNPSQNDMDQLLANAYTNSLNITQNLKINSIAFPAISTGVYAFPKKRAAVVVFNCLTNFIARNTKPSKIHLVFFKKDDEKIFKQSIKDMIDES